MVSIVDKIPKDRKFIFDVETYFDCMLNNLKNTKDFDNVVKTIDNAKVLSKNSRTCVIETPFGSTAAENLSTGCKSLIIALANPDIVVNFNEVGGNVLDLAFELCRDRDINIWLNKPLTTKYSYEPLIFNGEKMDYSEATRRLL
ncbi:MAG: DUF4869 domain-containing protein [Lachnospiraceae bacterium]|nr:DUF4869 domain-containing protein [Lachnospiraceae bacterium]